MSIRKLLKELMRVIFKCDKMSRAKEIMEAHRAILEKHRDSPEEYLVALNALLHRPKHKSHGPKVQLYDCNNLQKVVKVYNGITEASRKEPNTSFSHIKFAARNKTVYMGYRWFLIDKNDANPQEPRDIGETVPINIRKNGMVAMFESGKVSKVFVSQKEAADFVGLNASGISVAIKYNKQLGGYLWDMWNNVPQEQKNEYLKTNELPRKL